MNNITMKEKDGKKQFSFSNTEDGIEKTVRGEQVENGWIITIDKNWREKSDKYPTGDGEYKYECKKYISKESPLDKMEKNIDKKNKSENSILDTFKQIINGSGMLLID
jgi:hypothetical protein